MKKIIAVLYALMILLVSGCSAKDTDTDGKLKIVCTTFPEYDWVREVLGEDSGAEVTLLLGNGVDMHSYQPTASDLIKIADCDLFIYVGGESDNWAEDIIGEGTETINLLELLGDNVKAEEIVEGMQSEEEAETEDEIEYDEHVWLSLRNAQRAVSSIAEKLGSADSANADRYSANAEAYIAKLAELDERYKSVTDSMELKTLVFGDRFPFRYLTDDYGIDYYAAFPGCSSETEASFETVIFLANKCNELGLNSILTMEGSEHRIAETVSSNTKKGGLEILTMDSMQAVTDNDINEGATYLSIMENNLEVLEKALS